MGSAATTARFGAKTTGNDIIAAFPGAAKGRVALITGGTAGLGLETAITLAGAGAIIYLTGRSNKTVDAAVVIVKEKVPTAAVHGLVCDLGSIASVRACAAAFLATGSPLHLLINNAGVMACPRGYTSDGFETQFGTNHIGHFVLTNELLPRVMASAPARIINLSSMGHYIFRDPRGIFFDDLAANGFYCPWQRYGMSKLANILHVRELQHRIDASVPAGAPPPDVLAIALHPGAILGTNLMRHADLYTTFRIFLYPSVYPRMFGNKTTQEGIATTLLAALAPSTDLQRGGYYADCKVETYTVTTTASDDALAARLWTVSEELVAGVVARAASAPSAATS